MVQETWKISASEDLITLIWAIIVKPDILIFEGDIDQIPIHLKHMNGLKTAGNYNAPEYIRARTWAIIMQPDTIFSEDDSYTMKHLLMWTKYMALGSWKI